MDFDKGALTPEQRKRYDQFVTNLQAAPDHVGRQASRMAAMIPGAGDLMNVPGAMAAAEKEAGISFADSDQSAYGISFRASEPE
jgi:hypothetical protein